MQGQEQQQPDPSQRWEQGLEHFPWKRLIIFVAVVLLIVVGVASWILNSLGIIRGPWVNILTSLFVACGVIVGLLQWLFPVSSHKSPSATASTPPYHVPQIIVQVPPFHALSQEFASPQPITTKPLEIPPILAPTTIPLAEQGNKDVDTGDLSCRNPHQEDWEEAPHASNFYGRDRECDELAHWIVDDRCRMVAVLGMGGVGKTSLTTKVVERIKDEFEYVFWRSLQNAPSVEVIIKKCIRFLSNQQQIEIQEDIDNQIGLLVHYLRTHHCLLILDNVESILRCGDCAGQYSDGYEGYGRLFQHIGEVSHQSCLLITSREKPTEVARFEGSTLPVRSLPLSGVGEAEGQAILKDKGLLGSDEKLAALIRLYLGNPLALKLVAEPIHELFGDDITRFLRENEAVFGDIYDLFNQQFTRLSELERDVMYWLAIEREAVSLEDLREDIAYPVSKRVLFQTLNSLRRRSMIETTSPGCFILQPVIMECVTDGIIEQVMAEINSETVRLFASHALVKAQAKDYVRSSQVRIILIPLAERLLSTFGREGIQKKLASILSHQRETFPQTPGYAAGNVLNLLIQLQIDLRGTDFSHLVVWQAYLQNVALPGVNFASAHFAKCIFTDTFGSILSVAFNPKRNLLAVVTDTGEIRLWEVTDGIPLLTLHGHTDYVRSVAFSPDGSMLASGSDDSTIRLWDISTGHCFHILQEHIHRIRSVAFSPDGSMLASGSDDSTIRLWKVSDGHCIKTLQEHTHRIRSVAFSPDGSSLASGSDDSTIRLWEVSSGRCLHILQEHTHRIRSVAFSPDGGILASGSDDRTIRLWDVSDGHCFKTLSGHTHWLGSLAFSPDGNMLASGGFDQTVRLWEVHTDCCFNILQGHTNWVYSVAFNHDGSILASGSEDQTVRLWDVSSGHCLKMLQGYTNPVWSVAFSPDGTMLVSGSEDKHVRLWDVSTGRCLYVLQGHTNWIYSVAFSPDGNTVASGSGELAVRLWDVNTGRCLYTLQEHTNWVYSVAFSPDGSILASGSEDQTIRIWDVSTGHCTMTLQGHSGEVKAVAFNPADGAVLASGSGDQTVQLWNVSTGQSFRTLQGHTNWVNTVAFSPDGNVLASGSEDQTIQLWNVSTGLCLHILQGHSSWISSVAFSPDGSILASGSEDQTIRLWNVSTGQKFNILKGHSNRIRSVAFSPDGGTLVSGSHDGTIKFWNVQTGVCLTTLRSDRPYERMNITEVSGLTDAQKTVLRALGAIEDEG